MLVLMRDKDGVIQRRKINRKNFDAETMAVVWLGEDNANC